MNILFIGYWSVNEGLTKSTLIPHLEILSDFEEVKKIIFVSIERKRTGKLYNIEIPKCRHIPLYSKNLPLKFLNKWDDFKRFPKKIVELIRRHSIDFCIGAGTQAGTLGLKAAGKRGIKTVVSYYDPHAEYMLALGTWKKYDPRYLYLSYWEKRLKKEAYALFPVSDSYKKTLINEGVDPDKIVTVPCATNPKRFRIDRSTRNLLREKLNWNKNHLTGIYVGKFGDLYLESDAFKWFDKIKNCHPDFKLILLTGQDKKWIRDELIKAGFEDKDIFIGLVPHDEVAGYLNAADFAFCLHKPHKISQAYSPVKNGEYWACGLPVVMPDGIGDDSRILKDSGLGVVIEDLEKPEKYFPQLEELIKANKKEEIRQLAVKYRNPEIAKKAYEKLISVLTNEK